MRRRSSAIPVLRKQQGFSLGRSIAKGVRDLITGVATFPLDVVGATVPGSIPGRGADELAESIRRNIPEIETGGPVEDVTAAVTQFGIPGGAAGKVVGGLKVAQKAGAAGALSRFGLNVVAATGADILAADPGDVQSLGNLFPDLLPTGIDADEPALLKRLKLGIEAGTITATAIGTLGGVLLTWKGIAQVVRPFVNSDKVAEEVAARAVRELATDPDAAIASITKTIEDAQGTGFQPTTGTASRDPGLIALEKSLSTQGATSPAFAARRSENQAAVSQQLSDVTGRGDGEAALARQFFEESQTEARMAKTQIVEATEAQLKAVQDEIGNLADEINEFRSLETGASLEINEAVTHELQRLTLEKNRLFRAIDPGRSVPIEPDDLREVVAGITQKRGPLDSTPSKLPKVVGRLKRAVAEPKEGAEATPLHFGDLEDMRPDLSAAIAQARAANKGGVVERLIELRQALDQEAVKLAESASSAAARANAALTFFRDIFAPRFRAGVGRVISDASKKGRPIEPSAVGGKFIGTRPGSLEAGQDLERILQGIPDATQTREATRNFVLSKLSKAAIDPSDKFHPQRINRFLENHKGALAGFPDIRQEIQALSGRASTARTKVTQLERELADARDAVKVTEREANKSVTALFVGTDPEKAVGRVMAADDPAAAMTLLLAEASKDRTGQARNGMRVAVSDWVDNKVRSRTVNLSGDDFILVANQVEDLFKNPRTRGALEQIYTKPEMRVLERVRDQLRVMNRINTQVTTGSPTAALQQNVQRVRIVLASLYGIVKGRGVFAISQWSMRAAGKDPVANATAVLRDAMLDPDLGRLMLATNTGGGRVQRALEGRRRTYIANNIVGEAFDDGPRRRDAPPDDELQRRIERALGDLNNPAAAPP